jgi:hypothetical protein
VVGPTTANINFDAMQNFCNMAVGLAPGATPPANASLELLTNDSENPGLDVALTLSP